MANYLHRVILFDKNDQETIKLIGERLNDHHLINKSVIAVYNSNLFYYHDNSFYMFYYENFCKENYCDFFELNPIHFNSELKMGLYISKVIYESKSKNFGKDLNEFTLDLVRGIPDKKIIFMNLLEISKFRYIFKDKFIEKNFKSKQL
jgi:hypothetical protein